MESSNKLTLRFNTETLEFDKPQETRDFFGSNEILLNRFLSELMEKCENFRDIKIYQRLNKVLIGFFLLHLIFSFGLFISCVIFLEWTLLLVTITFVLIGLGSLLFLLFVKKSLFYRKLNAYGNIIQDHISVYNNEKFFLLDLEAFFYCFSENQNLEDCEGQTDLRNNNWRLFLRPSVAEDNKLRALVMNIDFYKMNFSLNSSCNSAQSNKHGHLSKSSLEKTDISAIMQYI